MRYPISTVLVASDLGPASDDVVRRGAAWARALSAPIHLVHAYPVPTGLPGAAWLSEPLLQESAVVDRTALAAELAAQVDRLGLAGQVAATTVAGGPAHRVIVEVARSVRAGLVVLGTASHAPGLARILGSTADRVLRQATCPVLLVRGADAVPPRRVLAPVDLSPLSADAFACGLDILRTAGAVAEVTALFVLSTRHGLAATENEDPDARALGALDHFVSSHAPADDRPVERRLRRGDPAAEIAAEIAGQPTDLVLLGTHGRGGFERLLVGSVAAEVAATAPVAVLVVPPEAALRAALSREAEDRLLPVAV